MDSKKLGMFAAAALTVLATQANAGETPAPKADPKGTAAKASGEVQCWGSCAPSCKGQVLTDIKDKAACTAKKGSWMTKAEYDKKQQQGKAHDHGHEHK